ncbi:hypothetical protein CH06BL_21920 [Chromobacterium haemolyticum]|nr:hypothetical protein CH06BL_21920 [Chromobacterium haemolyticum]
MDPTALKPEGGCPRINPIKTSPSAVERVPINTSRPSIDEAIEQEAIRRLQTLDPASCLTHKRLLEHVQQRLTWRGPESKKE